jgi:hypothetical protein
MYDVVDIRDVEASRSYISCQQDGTRGGFETLEVFQPLFLLQLRMQWICLQFQQLKKGHQSSEAVNGRKKNQGPPRIP